ncbi:MAG TPA: hypothetical protein VG929_11395 [Actinomycetota bacterium]|nr:hypothetical protein [Actinomycetota bacterium]
MEERAREDELGGDLPVDRETPGGYGVASSGAAASHTEGEPTRAVRGGTATSATEPAPAAPRAGALKVPLLVAALVVTTISAAVFATLYLTQETSPTEVSDVLADEAPEVRDTATRVANLLLNYDSTNLEAVSQQMLEVATGNFREQYEEVLAQGGGLGTALEEASASSRGEILEGPDVYFNSASEAIAITHVTQTAQSNTNPGGSTIDYILKITLIDTSEGGWKADRVEVLSTQQV